MLVTPAQLRAFAPVCDAATIAPALDAAAQAHSITTPLRLCHWLAQLHEETGGFMRAEEDLTYTTAARIRAVWPSRFPTLSAAEPYVRNPQGLAERVYGGRMGNANAGDGWRFRGRGYIQLTGRSNYAAAGKALGRAYDAQPDLVALPTDAAATAAWAWQQAGCNAMADREDIEAITRAINGGLTNITERRTQYARASAIWR